MAALIHQIRTLKIPKLDALSQRWNILRLSKLLQFSLQLYHELCNWDVFQISSRFEPCKELDYLSVSIFFALDVLLIFRLQRLFIKLVKLSIGLLKILFAQILLIFNQLLLTLLDHFESFLEINLLQI